MVSLEFFIDIIRPHYGPGVDSASNRNEYQEYFLGGGGVKAAGAYGFQPYHLRVLIVLKSGSLNFLEPSEPVQACNGIALPFTCPHLQPRLRLGGAIPLLLHTPGCLAQGQLYIYFYSSLNGSLTACLLIFAMRSHVPDRDIKASWRCVSHYWVKLY